MNTQIKPLLSERNNPFLEKIDSVLTDRDLHCTLRSSPLDGLDMKNLSKQARYDLLDVMHQEYFVPSLTSTDSASRFYTLIRKGYISRDPREIHVRKRAMVISRFAGSKLEDLPWLPGFALGMRIDGITGLGKTYEIRRAIDQLKPRIEHGKSAAADWTHFNQVPVLYVGMSFDGSIGGLLYQILVSLDVALGTDYSMQPRLIRLPNEKLAVHVGILMLLHAVGVLVIDEIQATNFSDGSRGTTARTFFLRMLNFGIPILLIGNPLGMRFIDGFSQDIRRFSCGGSIKMHPFEMNDENYRNVLAPGFWAYNVLPEPSSVIDPTGSILFSYCGGIRDFAGRLITAAQRIALDIDSPCLKRDHLDMAFNGPDFDQKERTMIRAFCNKNASALQEFEDIPWEDYFKKWEKPKPAKKSASTAQNSTQPDVEKAETAEEKSDAAGDTSSESESSVSKAKGKTQSQKTAENVIARRNRKQKANEKNETIKADLPAGDMRTTGIQERLVTELASTLGNH